MLIDFAVWAHNFANIPPMDWDRRGRIIPPPINYRGPPWVMVEHDAIFLPERIYKRLYPVAKKPKVKGANDYCSAVKVTADTSYFFINLNIEVNMSIVALSPIVAANYVPKADITNDNKTIFKLKPLNGMQGLEIMQELRFDETGKPLLTAKGLQLSLKYGLDGWENFLDESGQPIFFTPNNINRVRPDILVELAGEIINKSTLGGG